MLRRNFFPSCSLSRFPVAAIRSLSTDAASSSAYSAAIDWSKFYGSTSTPAALATAQLKRRRFLPTFGGDSALISNVNLARDSSIKSKATSALSFGPGDDSAAARTQAIVSVARTEFKRADMWSSGGVQKLPIADVPNLIDAINRKLPDSHKIDSKDIQQRLAPAAKVSEAAANDSAHINLNRFLEALSSVTAPAHTISPADADIASSASAHLAFLPGQFSDDLLATCLAAHGRSKLLHILRSMTIPEALLREVLVPSHSPAAINYAKLVLISSGITQQSPSDKDVRAAFESAGMFVAADLFTKAAIASGYNEDLSLPAGLESPGLAFSLLPSEALSLMDKIVLEDNLLSSLGVDKNDHAMVTAVKFMMVDTGLDEDAVQMISEEGLNGMVEDDVNQMFPSSKVWDENSRTWMFRSPASSVEKVAVNPSRSFFVPGRYRPIDLSAQRPTTTKIFRSKKHAFISSRNTSAVPRVTDVELLSLFIDPFGKIRSRRYTRATALRQRKLAKAVKGARLAGFLPFTTGPGLLGVTENISKGEESSGGPASRRGDKNFGGNSK